MTDAALFAQTVLPWLGPVGIACAGLAVIDVAYANRWTIRIPRFWRMSWWRRRARAELNAAVTEALTPVR